MIVVLTGASRGLGRAAARKLIELGHTVLACARSQDTLPAPHEFARVDVTDPGAVNAWAADLLQRHGPPDLLLNNAALINRNARLWEVPAAEFRAVLDVNVWGTYLVLKAFVPAMITAGRGVVVNFSSGWGRSTSPEVAPYCATKWAIEGLTSALAQELPPGVAAVALNPGIIDTDMLRSCFGHSAGHYDGPEDWAERAVPYILRLGAQHNGRSLSCP